MSLDPTTAALVVHDLKNALGAVEAALQRLAEDEAFDRRLAHDTHRQCQVLRQRFVTFLTLYGGAVASSEQGAGLKAWCSDESPEAFLSGWARRHGLLNEGHPVTLDEAALAAPDLPAVGWFDPRLLTMALDAAAHNAQRFARSRIAAGVRAEQGGCCFWVEDDGRGLGEAPVAGASGALPTGLGTALCRAVAAAHVHGERRGTVRLFNRVDAHGAVLGARFELWLP